MRCHNLLLQAVLVWQAAAGSGFPRSDAGSTTDCHVLPTDAFWPSADAWQALNATVNGQLVASVPLGSPCHDPDYDATACQEVQQQWQRPEFHLASSSSVMESFFANQSCDPFTPRNWTCTLGNYVSYAVNVSTPADVAATIKFAKQHNIRLVIRNTGHDFLGRSTGAGGLAIWVHALSQTEIVQWADEHYTGPALRAGAGVLGAQAVEAAAAQGLAVVTGECPTVGLAGGFTQGGGHSALSTSFGMAADQVLEYEVVVADGRVLKASPACNADLYWALSGGGGGTYAVVTAITVRAHPSATVGGGQLAISLQYTNQSSFDAAVSEFHALLPDMVAAGCSLSYILTSSILQIGSITAFNSTGDIVRSEIMAPFIKVLSDLGIPSQSAFTTLSYRDHYNTYMGPLPNGHLTVEAYQFGGRLIPRSVVQNNNSALQAVIKETSSQGVILVGTASSWLAPPKAAPNAVLPAWREALIQMQLLTPWDATNWDKMAADRAAITDVFVPLFEAVTPGSGTYTNEADFNQPNWQETFYGSNYAALLAVKQKWDPDHILYSLKSVGSDSWTVASDGRMCRA